MDTSLSWEEICDAFPILKNKDRSDCTADKFNILHGKILNSGSEWEVIELVMDRIELELRQNVAPRFWGKFTSRSTEMEGFEKFKEAVSTLYGTLSLFLPTLERLETLRNSPNNPEYICGEKRLLDTFKVITRATLHSQLPIDYQIITEDFYKVAFTVFCNTDKSDLNESAEDAIQCSGCNLETDQCQCKNIIQIFHETNRMLIELGLLERLAGDVLTRLIHKRIENHVQETCKGSFDTSYTNTLEEWLETVVMGWLTNIYGGGSSSENSVSLNSDETQNFLRKFKQKLEHLLYETYTRTRIEQLFNIIIEYPDSEPAVEDLRLCLEKTDLRGHLMGKLQRALETRLLHPGVNTPDILTAYIAAIRALRQLDPSGVLLDTVTHPIRQYLRCREDTVRCVVTSLRDEGPNDLAEELQRGQDSPAEDGTTNWEKWMPDPVDADPSKLSKARRTSDVISMLVSVYGSKDLFVNEYRTLLADRLLAQFTFNTDKEIRYLELLKLRFGDSQLHYCEVMLKDIHDSKRMNAHLHSDPAFELSNKQFVATAIILSAQFWPVFKDETLELPEIVKEHLNVYTKAFETLKGNRTLSWKPHLGAVNLDITIKDRTVNLTVTPIHATIICHFETKPEWTIDELSQVMHVPPTVLRRRIAFWQSQGLIWEASTDKFILVEDSVSGKWKSDVRSEMVCEEEETESAMASAHDQREEELQVFWSYIVGMLTNLDSMPLERIHQMLKMFASQGPSTVECSLQELRHFLERKVKEQKLIFSGGLYRLPKP
nr:PREDICTED: anaphase-promoting complex subunit 2 [Bemisia tabaci]